MVAFGAATYDYVYCRLVDSCGMCLYQLGLDSHRLFQKSFPQIDSVCFKT